MLHSPDCRALDVIVPFYCDDFARPLFSSLQEITEELTEINSTLVVINHSPEQAALQQALSAGMAALSPTIPCRLMESQRNAGLARFLNDAFRQAIASRHDVLLLHSGVIVFPGTLSNLRKIAACDPLIGFVNPRSNNGGLCTFAREDEFPSDDPTQCHSVFQQLCGYLPEFQFVPEAEGFCLWIKLEVIEEFGLFDETYTDDGWRLKDLTMRANRCGYRTAVANHAFAYHAGRCACADISAPQPVLDREAALLKQRYPEYAPSRVSYLRGIHSQAEGFLSALLPDKEGRLDLLFDFSSLAPYHNGTFEVSMEILRRAAKRWRQFHITVLASQEAVRFHRIDEVERISLVPPNTRKTFALALRIGQPFDYEQFHRMSTIAPLNVYCMLDPIAFDCLYLNSPGLETIWSAVFAHADGVIYISDFVKEHFGRHFRKRPGLHELVAYQSFDYRDYTPQPVASGGDYILVAGNAFAHKRVPTTVEALREAFPNQKIAALGLSGNYGPNVVSYPSGYLSEKEIDQLWRGARFVVFPSLYEGFGIPIVKSLAYGKPVLARSIPPAREIKQKLDGEENLILYSSTTDLIRKLQEGFPAWKTGAGPRGVLDDGWDAIVAKIGCFLLDVSRSQSFGDVLLPRLQHVRLLDRSGDESGAAARIQAIYDSWSWRLTAPLRRLADAYIRLKKKTK